MRAPTPRRRGWQVFALVNGAALAVAAAGFPLMLWLAQHTGGVFSFCFFHDVLHLYCVTCGGTRATWQLLHGQIWDALRSNAAVVWTYAALAAVDLRGLVLLLRGGERPFRLPHAFWWTLLIAGLGYALLRDVSLVAFHWDWVGDFL